MAMVSGLARDFRRGTEIIDLPFWENFDVRFRREKLGVVGSSHAWVTFMVYRTRLISRLYGEKIYNKG